MFQIKVEGSHVRKQRNKDGVACRKMPSLPTKAEPAMATDPVEISRSMSIMMDKKIRNLEKRKVVLLF